LPLKSILIFYLLLIIANSEAQDPLSKSNNNNQIHCNFMATSINEHLVNSLLDLENIYNSLKNNERCPNPPESFIQCFKNQACNINSSLFSMLEPVLKWRKLTTSDTCGHLSKGESDCYQNLTQGIWQNLVLYKDFIVSSAKYIFVSENKTSNILHLLRKMKNPVTFIKSLVTSILQAINEGIKYHFSCERWEFDDFINHGKCLAPATSWACANCNQHLNAFCGVVGYILGQPLSSFITGFLTGAISGTVEASQVASPAIKNFFLSIKKAKEAMISPKNITITSAGNVAGNATPNLWSNYQDAMADAFWGGYSGGKGLALNAAYQTGGQTYKEAFFVFKMEQHRKEVAEVGKKYILDNFTNNSTLDPQRLVDLYDEFINHIHDINKINDPVIRAKLAAMYGKSKNIQTTIDELNTQEMALANNFFKEKNISTAEQAILHSVEKGADQVSRYLATREVTRLSVDLDNGSVPVSVDIKHIRYSNEFGRAMTPPWQPYKGINPSEAFKDMTLEMADTYLKMKFPTVYY